MTELEMKLLAQLKGLLSDVEGLMGESGGVYGMHLNGDVSPWGELEEGGRFERLSHMSSARAVVAEAEAARPHIGVGQMWRNRNGDLIEIVRKLDAPDRFRRQYLDADDCAYRHDGSFSGDGGFPCGYDLVELVGKEDRQ